MYWVHQYRAVVNEINELRFYVYTEWSNKYCDICRYNTNELTVELTYDQTLAQVEIDLHHTINNACGCRIIHSSINEMNDEEYEYRKLNHMFYDSYYDYRN